MFIFQYSRKWPENMPPASPRARLSRPGPSSPGQSLRLGLPGGTGSAEALPHRVLPEGLRPGSALLPQPPGPGLSRARHTPSPRVSLVPGRRLLRFPSVGLAAVLMALGLPRFLHLCLSSLDRLALCDPGSPGHLPLAGRQATSQAVRDARQGRPSPAPAAGPAGAPSTCWLCGHSYPVSWVGGDGRTASPEERARARQDRRPGARLAGQRPLQPRAPGAEGTRLCTSPRPGGGGPGAVSR